MSNGFSGIELSSLEQDGIYYLEVPLGADGELFVGRKVRLNISADASYNEYDMSQDGRVRNLSILNLSIVNSTLREGYHAEWSFENVSASGSSTIGSTTEEYGVSRSFEFEYGELE